MRPVTRLFSKTLFSVCVVLLGGCALVDEFNGRAIQYNDQTSEAKRSTILMNVLRAAYAEPLQFTDVTTVSGLSTVSTQPTASIPFPMNAAAAAAARGASLTPSVTLQGQNTVNVGNLNNQEFYSGIQTPLSMQQIAFYMLDGQNGLTPSQLLPLFISDIEVTANGKKYILRNRGDKRSYFLAFYYAIDALLQQGLSVEATDKKAAPIGPVLTESEAKDPKLLSAIIGASTTPPTLKELPTKIDGKSSYQLQRENGGGYRFCFRRNFEVPKAYRENVDLTIVGRPNRRLSVPLGFSGDQPALSIEIGEQYYCGANSTSTALGGRKYAVAQGLNISIRSLEGMIYFLGEMARTELGLANGLETSLELKLNETASYRLFNIERRLPSPGEPWVYFRSQPFAIAVDPSGSADTSSRILQLLTDLLALQSSAKSLPAPNVIAVTTQ
ncbi:hypothetical protein [Bradyrhizobium tropiciagri]|uniref:hypothetical protein n=1 Tax=Bradyrhizobium tropiciagri TaxID=312253 RepID=UPI00067BBDE7|nr:hypothetical protein [Bradyrhizobium tropiciagri]